jgi:hypothetical protein
MTVQSYTVTSVASTQPTSASYTVEVDNPKIKVSGITPSSYIEMRVSMDGNNPDATDIADIFDSNGVFVLDRVKTGNKIVFKGYGLIAGKDITIEVENS